MGSSASFQQRTHLEVSRRWPSVARLLNEARSVIPSAPGRNDSWWFLHNVFWERPGGDSFVDEYEELLAYGYRTDGLNKDRRARLLSADGDQHTGAWAELRVGHWLDTKGLNTEQWDPPARREGRGDILVKRGAHRLFVEVKALRGDQGYQDRGTARDAVARDVQTWLRIYPELTFGLVVEDATPPGERYDQASAKKVVVRAARRVRTSGNSEVVQIPKGDSVVLVDVQPEGPGADTSVGQVGFLGIQHSLRTLLNSVQKPRERIPAIAAIYDAEAHLVSFDDRSGPDVVAEVCYGTSTEDVTGKMERRYRKQNGLWTRPKPSSLDAIFVIAARYFEDEEPGSLVWGYLSQSDEAAIVKTVMRDCVDRWVGPNDWQRR